MQLVQTIAVAIGALGGVLSIIIGAKLFGPDKRKTQADTTLVMSEAAVIWMDRYEGLVEYVDRLETTQNELFDWIRARERAQEQWLRAATAILEDRGVLLPPIPDTGPLPARAKRPPRQRKET